MMLDVETPWLWPWVDDGNWNFVSERTRDEIKTTEQWNQIVASDDAPVLEICFDSDEKTDTPGVDDDGYEPLELRSVTKFRWDRAESQ